MGRRSAAVPRAIGGRPSGGHRSDGHRQSEDGRSALSPRWGNWELAARAARATRGLLSREDRQ